MNLIHKFETDLEKENYYSGTNYGKPNVNLIVNTKEVLYNYDPFEYGRKRPLTFIILTDGTISGTKFDNNTNSKTIYYSINNGEWVSLVSDRDNPPTINVSAGDVVEFKGNNQYYSGNGTFNYYTTRYNKFKTTCDFDVCGNIMSMINGEDFINTTSMTAPNAFVYFFSTTNVISAKFLILPTNTQYQCYYNMFQGCSKLTVAPRLTATTLSGMSCYKYMFSSCGNLQYIEAGFTGGGSQDYTEGGTLNVADKGTFVKHPDQTIVRNTPISYKYHAIPKSGTVIDANIT